MKKFKQIAQFGQKLMTLSDMDHALDLISEEAKTLLDADRCSIFIVDLEDKILWTKLSDGVGRIVVSLSTGIVGHTYQSQRPQIVNTPYSDDRFLQAIDKKSGYETKNIITVPIFDSKRDVIGIIELLNKVKSDFDESDLSALTFFANYVSGSLELILMNEN